MPRFVLAASLIAVVALAACGAAPVPPTASPSDSPASPSAPPSLAPSPSVTPPPIAQPPAPTPRATPKPTPAPPDFTAAEQYLLDGVRRGAKDCHPAGGSDDLPRDAIAGIECNSTDPAVARIGFYLFANDDDMLNAYLFRMRAEGVEMDSGSCFDGEGESAYIPGEGVIPQRNGCFINEEGYANYRATLPGEHVYIGILGTSKDTLALENFAWKGNQDTPGNPTLWGQPS
jgi:hypothetical protein